MKITKEDAVKKAALAAKEYNDVLSSIKYLLLCRNNKTNETKCIEIHFPKYAFQHLTGLSLSSTSTLQSAVDFFDACIKSKLSTKDVEFNDAEYTPQKLEILPRLIRFVRFSKMMVTFIEGRPLLKCDKVVGTTNYCIALKARNDFYIPVSCLNEDVRNFGNEIFQVVAVFSANLEESVYIKICNVAKNVDLTKISIPTEFTNKISLENYKKG